MSFFFGWNRKKMVLKKSKFDSSHFKRGQKSSKSQKYDLRTMIQFWSKHKLILIECKYFCLFALWFIIFDS